MRTLSHQRAEHAHRAAPAIAVDTVSDYAGFLRLEPVWNRLAEAAKIDHPFLTHSWTRVWWNCFGADARLNILVIQADGEPVAIAPMMVSHDRVYGFKLRRLRFIHNDHTPTCDFIVAPGGEDAARAVWRHLRKNKSDWDLIELPETPENSAAVAQLVELAAADGFLVGAWASRESPYAALAGDWDGYVRQLRKHHRSNLNNRMNRLKKLGPIELEVITKRAEIAAALEEGYRIEAAAWKGEAGTAIDSQPELKRFYTAFADTAAERGWLRLYFLTVNGARIAFDYCLCYRDKLYSLKIGYDPRLAAYSPCNLLKYFLMRDAFELGLSESHFLGTADKWKLEWARETQPHSWHFVFSPDARGVLLHWAKFQAAPRLKQRKLYASVRRAALATRNFLMS